MKRLAILLVAVMLLTACGGAASPSPSAEAATATPLPTQEPTPEPTAEPTEAPTPVPTPIALPNIPSVEMPSTRAFDALDESMRESVVLTMDHLSELSVLTPVVIDGLRGTAAAGYPGLADAPQYEVLRLAYQRALDNLRLHTWNRFPAESGIDELVTTLEAAVSETPGNAASILHFTDLQKMIEKSTKWLDAAYYIETATPVPTAKPTATPIPTTKPLPKPTVKPTTKPLPTPTPKPQIKTLPPAVAPIAPLPTAVAPIAPLPPAVAPIAPLPPVLIPTIKVTPTPTPYSTPPPLFNPNA